MYMFTFAVKSRPVLGFVCQLDPPESYKHGTNFDAIFDGRSQLNFAGGSGHRAPGILNRIVLRNSGSRVFFENSLLATLIAVDSRGYENMTTAGGGVCSTHCSSLFLFFQFVCEC